ncbi:MAG: hypothetical protein ACYDC3_19485, partial [Candidatus Binataceae bacterium]
TTWMNLYQNATGMATTSAMIADQSFAAGGDGFLANYGRFSATMRNSNIHKRLWILHSLLDQCARVSILLQADFRTRQEATYKNLETMYKNSIEAASVRGQIDGFTYEEYHNLPLKEREAASRRDRKRRRGDELSPKVKIGRGVGTAEILSDGMIDAIAELVYLENQAIAVGAIPSFMSILN